MNLLRKEKEMQQERKQRKEVDTISTKTPTIIILKKTFFVKMGFVIGQNSAEVNVIITICQTNGSTLNDASGI